jgi:hypothetical protein
MTTSTTECRSKPAEFAPIVECVAACPEKAIKLARVAST